MDSSKPSSRTASGIDETSRGHVTGVVAIGVSSGGLEALLPLIDGLPSDGGLAFILVQNLNSDNVNIPPERVSNHTTITAVKAADGQRLKPGHLFIAPSEFDITVHAGTISLSEPPADRNGHTPFDGLLHSLAGSYGAHATGILLSGTGADGNAGLRSIRDAGGKVYLAAQGAPDARRDDGTDGNVPGHVMPLTAIGPALRDAEARAGQREPHDAIFDLLRHATGKDFSLYKQATLQRRLERRMTMAGVPPSDPAQYLKVLEENPLELSQLATDILINVTNFFRDPDIFRLLRTRIVPELVKNHPIERTLRLWIAGCSTGEEAFSLAMIMQECFSEAKRGIKMQIFASDADEEAIAFARDGLYPRTIEADISPERLRRFFVADEHGYRVVSELRACVIFAVQNILTDPPFSNIDFMSCRNMLIYFGQEAQAKVAALCHFSLNENGILLLGNAETVETDSGCFDVIDKSARLFRRKGQRVRHGLAISTPGSVRASAQHNPARSPARQAALADLCRRTVIDTYAPATAVISRDHECLYFLGPVQRYLRVAPGHPTQDLFAALPRNAHAKLRSALHRALRENGRVVATGFRHGDETLTYDIAVQPAVSEGEDLFLVSFIDGLPPPHSADVSEGPADDERVRVLEQELAATRTDLQAAIRDIEEAAEEQKTINAEALSLNAEYQSANEELLISKEELQSLNEELTALNVQLKESLERQRATANDLENVLYSTNIATIFLDSQLNIRYFTPATRSIFNVIVGDIGRPLADLNARVPDLTLISDAVAVLRGTASKEREIRTTGSVWYMRRIVPYRTQEGGTEGVVITFADISAQHRASEALDRARRAAERANAAKSRFLAAASHDLRQPLQSLVLLQGLLEKSVEDEKSRKLIKSLRDTLHSMSGMLNALLDINQIEAGTVYPRIVTCRVDDVLRQLQDEFSYGAAEKGLQLRYVPSRLPVRTDPRLLEQMVRNLLANAVKYTRQGKILIGCRRRGNALTIEVWDSGVGIQPHELQTIFDEYHQAASDESDDELGLGLGLSIVRRLSMLLGHRVHVRSVPDKGSVFSIHVALGLDDPQQDRLPVAGHTPAAASPVQGSILVVEDDQKIRSLIEIALRDEQHRVYTADDGLTAIELLAHSYTVPSLILADYNLPHETNGVDVVRQLRSAIGRHIPAIILTGDITAETLRILSAEDCLHMPKPVSLGELLKAIQQLLRTNGQLPETGQPDEPHQPPSDEPAIVILDDDHMTRETLRGTFETDGRAVRTFSDGEAFLAALDGQKAECLLMDVNLPGMSGLDVLRTLRGKGATFPVIMITGAGDVATAVLAMKAGASDFIEKPIGPSALLASVTKAIERKGDAGKRTVAQKQAMNRLAGLTERQREILDRVLKGQPSKVIAMDLKISQRTVEAHRAAIMKRMGVGSLPALARLVVLAENADG